MHEDQLDSMAIQVITLPCANVIGKVCVVCRMSAERKKHQHLLNICCAPATRVDILMHYII